MYEFFVKTIRPPGLKAGGRENKDENENAFCIIGKPKECFRYQEQLHVFVLCFLKNALFIEAFSFRIDMVYQNLTVVSWAI